MLDGDDADAPLPVTSDALGFFTWSRRHIESYLLVPEAIARSLGLRVDDRRLQHFFDTHVPAPGDAEAWRRLDAKRLLGERGAFSQTVGRSLPLARDALAPATTGTRRRAIIAQCDHQTACFRWTQTHRLCLVCFLQFLCH